MKPFTKLGMVLKRIHFLPLITPVYVVCGTGSLLASIGLMPVLRTNNKIAIGTIASKINGTPRRCLLAHFEATLDFNLANLLAHNNKSQICYCGQISLQSAAVNYSFSDNLTPLGVPFILLAMVHPTPMIRQKKEM